MKREDVERYLVQWNLQDLFVRFPYLKDMFAAIRLDDALPTQSVTDVLSEHPDECFTDYGYTKSSFCAAIIDFIERFGMEREDRLSDVESLTVLGGCDKDGNPEKLELTIRKGEMFSIVGPTGAGKTRFLEDIEGLVQGDSPTGRRILINGDKPTPEMCDQLDHRLVAQLTQNMNFVIDLTAGEFIEMHAASRGVKDAAGVAQRIIECANNLSGERFSPDVPVTQLSGGQSRALMTADTALLSTSPIVLIDEIENAGIDRLRALNLIVDAGKIVIMSTHDPMLALYGGHRLVIRNGAVVAVLESTPEEMENLHPLASLNEFTLSLRERIRSGERLEGDLHAELERVLANSPRHDSCSEARTAILCDVSEDHEGKIQ